MLQILVELKCEFANNSNFHKVVEMTKKQLMMKICRLMSSEPLKKIYANLECGFPCIERNPTVSILSFE